MMNLPPISPKQATQFMRQYHSNIPPTSSEDLLLVGPGGLAHIRKEWVAEYEKYEQELKDAEDCEASQLDFIETYNGGNVNGFVASINRIGVSSSKHTTASTHPNAAKTSARAVQSFTGRVSPFKRLTESSLLRPTTSLVPYCAASARYSTCPRCKISKHPLVNTTVSPLKLHTASIRRYSASAASKILFLIISNFVISNLLIKCPVP